MRKAGGGFQCIAAAILAGSAGWVAAALACGMALAQDQASGGRRAPEQRATLEGDNPSRFRWVPGPLAARTPARSDPSLDPLGAGMPVPVLIRPPELARRPARLDDIIIPPVPRLAQRPTRPEPLPQSNIGQGPVDFAEITAPRLVSEPRLVTRRKLGALSPAFVIPIASGRITSMFNRGRFHPAIDLAGALGSPVFATTARQTVVFAGWRGGYGNAVITRDDQGRTHLYGHLQSITTKVGEVLDQRQQLGHLGSTGYSTGPHVHYEVKSADGLAVNPVALLFPGLDVAAGYRWDAQDGVMLTAAGRPQP
jgi:murein DD-endopeptidase MepM/ murein hydrolase activator NlpD